MNTKKYLLVAASLATLGALALSVTTFAATTPTSTTPSHGDWPMGGSGHGPMTGMMMKAPAVVGSVSAVSGNTLTVSGRTGFGFSTSTPATIFSVNAANATVFKNNATSSLASVAVGDTVVVQGTTSGTTVTATSIRDGVIARGIGPRTLPPGFNPGGPITGKHTGTSTPPTNKPTNPLSSITGNGQPVIAGSISAISGSTLTVTNKSNVTYTVDASSAKIVQGQNATATLSNLAVGDSVVVQGTVNGTSVTASTVIDQAVKPASTTSGGKGPQVGFFAGIGQFFSHLFGF